MAQRVVRNDFVAGEIDPSLWGRHDVEMFFHGAARLENFVPRKTGGVRKRAGTELVWRLSGTEARDYRIVPYRYDKDEYGLIALYRKGTATQVYANLWTSRAGAGNEYAVPFLSISRDVSLSDIRHEQIGDTIFFTLHGHRAWTAVVTFATRSAQWKQLRTSIPVANPPALSTTASGFHAEGDGYVAAYREYALWGVKDGVRSDPRIKRQAMTLKWDAGAYIDVTFTPNWAAHDYYILGKLQGGQYGEVARFYRDSDNGSRSYTARVYGGSQRATGTFGEDTYTAALSSIADVEGGAASPWRTTDPDTVTNNIHACGSWVYSFGLSTTVPSSPLLAIKLWFGAKMSGNGSVANVGYSEPVHAVLYNGSAAGDIIAEWDFTPGYQEEPAKLAIDNPRAAASYALHFYTDATRTVPVYVPMRGAIMCTDTGSKTFHDDNIQPGTLVGEQDLLQVGFSGMDVDIITTWQQRLVAASAEQSPFTMWFSAVGDLYNFYVDRPQTSDNAFEATIASTEANRILHIVSQKWLLAFTESGEHVVEGSGGQFAYNTISIKKTSSVGAHPDIVPTTTESDVLFVAADARSVYQMDYSLERDAVVPKSVSTRAQHLTELHRIKKIAYQRYPDSVLWCLLDDGSLASMTFIPDENVCGWARHTLAGGAGLKVEDIFCTGSIRADADTDTTSEICLVLRSTATADNGKVWVERLRPCVVSDSPTTAHAKCLDHTGYAAGDYPAGGNPEGEVSARLVTMRMDPQQADMIGKQTNVFDSVLRIRRSGKVSIRPAGSGLAWSGTATQPDSLPTEGASSVALVEKDVKIAPRAWQNRDARLEIVSADKWPCEILALLAQIEFGNMKMGG